MPVVVRPQAEPLFDSRLAATCRVVQFPMKMPDSLVRAPVLLAGAHGMLGRAWEALLRRRGIEVVPVDRDTVDLTRPSEMEQLVEHRFKLVINCAAWTDVDGAEGHEEEAMRINAHAVEHMARQCARIDATLVHYSTDYVFDGRADRPYPTSHERTPINAYGRSKALGEQLLEASRCRSLLIRASWLYAPWGRNFVRTMVKLLRHRDSVRVVHDQRGRPTSAEHLAQSSLALLEKRATGTWHITDGGDCTWHEFASRIAELISSPCSVLPCTSAAHPLPAARPPYGVLDLSDTERLLEPMPPWQDNLVDVVHRLEDE